jgi:hypothetical protein
MPLRIRADLARVHLSRIPLTLRALVLVPLLAAGMDQVRASVVCGPGARTCLEAAGQSGMGMAGVAVLVLYALASALLVAKLARGRASTGLWAVGTAGLWVACGGQALLASALGGALGGGWAQLLAFGLLAGAVLAVALKALPAAKRLIWSLRPDAPRPPWRSELAWAVPVPASPALRLAFARSTRDRAPPTA